MLFGLKNAAQAFQRLMDGILREVDFAFVYLDDILVASPDEETHKSHLRKLFSLLSSHGVFINRKKCHFARSEVQYLGHVVGERGILPNPARVQVIRDFQQPSTKVGLQRFLGMLNYYRRFVPHCSDVLEPLHAAVTAAGKAKDVGQRPRSMPSRKQRRVWRLRPCFLTQILFL